MNPFYFGDSDKPLFGVYHPPKTESYPKEGVLLCYPLGREYEKIHWMFRKLANLLSKNGVHVMRFDYYGTGDSAGERDEASIGQWLDDIQVALDELKDMARVDRVSVVGLRLGAALAALATEKLDIKNLVLWDPVVNGEQYVGKMKAMHDSLEIMTGPEGTPNDGTPELLGNPFSSQMESAMIEIDLVEKVKYKADQIFMVVSREKEEYQDLRERLTQRGTGFEYRVVPESGDWENKDEIWGFYFANNTVQAIADFIKGKDL